MKSLFWENNQLKILDQTKLPQKSEYIYCSDYQCVAEAINNLSVRGAPAIGVAAAYGLVLGIMNITFPTKDKLINKTEEVAHELFLTRPTAVNLQWSLNRMINKLKRENITETEKLKSVLLEEAHQIFHEDIETNMAIGNNGNALIPYQASILNHCNAGALATAGYGTSLGVVRAAHKAGKNITAYVNETRPLLQGARLTMWEMLQENIPAVLITDNMAASLMSLGKVDLVIVGADRITANGDTANKIGTYGLAVLAKEHEIPFYVAAPFSTIDFNLFEGKEVPIEERKYEEVTHIYGQRIAPEGAGVWNPAFDITPAKYINAIITERAVIKPPYPKNLSYYYNTRS